MHGWPGILELGLRKVAQSDGGIAHTETRHPIVLFVFCRKGSLPVGCVPDDIAAPAESKPAFCGGLRAGDTEEDGCIGMVLAHEEGDQRLSWRRS